MTEQEIVEKVETAATELRAANNTIEQLQQALALAESQITALAKGRGSGGGGATGTGSRKLQEILAALTGFAVFAAVYTASIDPHKTIAAAFDAAWKAADPDVFVVVCALLLWVASAVTALRLYWWSQKEPWLNWRLYKAWQTFSRKAED